MSVCRQCPSVGLLAQKSPVLQIQAVLLVLNTLKLCKLPCLCFFLLDTLYKRLKSCVLSWHCSHAYRPRPDTWPPVQREMTVSVFLGFTMCICETMVCSYPQGSTRIATWRAGYVLYRALVSKYVLNSEMWLTTRVQYFQISLCAN